MLKRVDFRKNLRLTPTQIIVRILGQPQIRRSGLVQGPFGLDVRVNIEHRSGQVVTVRHHRQMQSALHFLFVLEGAGVQQVFATVDGLRFLDRDVPGGLVTLFNREKWVRAGVFAFGHCQ